MSTRRPDAKETDQVCIMPKLKISLIDGIICLILSNFVLCSRGSLIYNVESFLTDIVELPVQIV